ncbi:DUF2523 domain-containing protein [Kingella kingae]|uniref:DUF2523 domain-containing protein n=1 Tax=Kingella kingae TaxID=504 RepID=UPI002550D580|nr:DUF2523 domain-containing protein [Kingella kingae]MDK4650707.1 DUF2523 domain-containing protein [Kingella kingae]
MTVLMQLLTYLFTTLTGRIISALGLSFVTYTSVKEVQAQFVNYLVSSVSRMPSEALQIFYLAGGGVALNYIIGAVTFSLGLVSMGKLSSVFNRK